MRHQHVYQLTILERHLDTFGHVNNATYLEIFEEARWDLITKGGFGLKEIQERKIGPVILEIDIKFRKEVGLHEKVRVATELLEYSKKTGKMRQTLFNQKGQEACIALFVFGLFDLKRRKLIPPTPKWLKAIGA